LFNARLSIALLLSGTLASGTALAADGEALYKANCAKCHGDTGMADTTAGKAAKSPKLRGEEKLRGEDVAEVVTKSVRDPKKKKHNTVSKKVTDEDLAAIATFVKVLATSE
jgi:mono/diheme cytochrome c family protein